MTSAFFTITARNYLHYARALGASLAQHSDQIERVLVIVDAPSESIARNELPEFNRVIYFDDIELPQPDAFSFRYDVMELCTAVKPFVFGKLVAEGFDRLVYLDPDILVYRPLSEVFAALASGASSVLTPHSLAPILHAEPPNDLTFLRAGAYNLGFMAIADTPHSRNALQWWQARLEHECVSNRIAEGVFVDQKFMDLWPSYCADTVILRDPTYNVAYWNLDTRQIAATEDGYLVEGRPLTFFHFSGIVPGNRNVLSRHQKRWTTASRPELRSLVDTYHDALDRSARAKWSAVSYGYAAFRDGTIIPKIARVHFREELEPFSGDPFEALPRMLDLPAAVHPNPFGVVTQLMHTLWKERPDLQAHFHLRDANSQLQYGEWYTTNGAVEAGIPATFAEMPRRALAAAAQQASGTRKRFRTRVARLVLAAAFRIRPHFQLLYRHIPADRRRRLIDKMLGAAWPAERLPSRDQQLEHGLSLIGYPFAEMGVGEAMRSLAHSLAATEVPFEIVNFDVDIRQRQQDRSLSARLVQVPNRRANVFCVNADMIGSTMRAMGDSATAGRYNIVRPFWELPRIHPDWQEALSHIDEVWAPTHFVKEAFVASGIERVVHVPVAIDIPSDILPRRFHFGIPVDATVYLFAFDFSSYPSRKNPQAVLDAYRSAFGADVDAPVVLVIKTMGQSPVKPRILAEIAELARKDPRIIVIDEVLTRQDMHALTASCDVFVSLHRSEGFGLGIAEAMAMGKAVVATDFSGSVDFVSAETGCPVPYRLIEVKPEDYPYYVEGQIWADPDVEASAKIMRSLFENSALRLEIGARARQFITEVHSPAAVGAIVAARLVELGQD